MIKLLSNYFWNLVRETFVSYVFVGIPCSTTYLTDLLDIEALECAFSEHVRGSPIPNSYLFEIVDM